MAFWIKAFTIVMVRLLWWLCWCGCSRMPYPLHRLRRFRRTASIRKLFAESALMPRHLVQPLLIGDHAHGREWVMGSTLIEKLSLDLVLKEIEALLGLGMSTVFLQAFSDEKDIEATAAWTPEGLMQRTIVAIKKEFEDDCTVISETSLRTASLYNLEGVVLGGELINDPTAELIAKTALAQADAGADFVCPTEMTDGRVLFTRDTLDDAGHEEVGILAASAKYASALHRGLEPLPDGYGVDPASYQIGVGNQSQALLKIQQDLEEGADAVLFSPMGLTMDLLIEAQNHFEQPMAVYQTASEAAMIELAANEGWFDAETIALEQLTTAHRAGADFMVSFYAKTVAEIIR